MNQAVIVVAGGMGTRLGDPIPKQFLLLNKYPVLWHTLNAWYRFNKNMNIILVLHKAWRDYWHKQAASCPYPIPVTLVTGGLTRAASVKNGLMRIPKCDFVAVHDAVRPLLRTPFLKNIFDDAYEYGNAVPVLPISESLRKVNGATNRAIDRTNVFQVQTPQVFPTEKLIDAFESPEYIKFTDEASLFEHQGNKVHLTKGDPLNIKITVPEDLQIAAALLPLLS